MKILIVDDKPTNLISGMAAVIRSGYKGISCATLQGALGELNNADCVIMDLFFPDNTGMCIKKIFIDMGEKLGVSPKRLRGDKDLGPVKFVDLDPPPCGEWLANQCLRKGIPFTILSDGELHTAELASWRYYFSNIALKHKQLLNCEDWPSLAVFPHELLLFNKDGVDKLDDQVWFDAIEYVTSLTKK